MKNHLLPALLLASIGVSANATSPSIPGAPSHVVIEYTSGPGQTPVTLTANVDGPKVVYTDITPHTYNASVSKTDDEPVEIGRRALLLGPKLSVNVTSMKDGSVELHFQYSDARLVAANPRTIEGTKIERPETFTYSITDVAPISPGYAISIPLDTAHLIASYVRG